MKSFFTIEKFENTEPCEVELMIKMKYYKLDFILSKLNWRLCQHN